MRTEARFPNVDPGVGHYESFYIKATDPQGGRGVWIRHTVHQRPGEPRTASVWFTYFDASAAHPRATKATVGADELSAPDGTFIRIAKATLSPGAASGAIDTPELNAAWDLRFTDGASPLHHLPAERLYRSKLPRTKFLSPYPASSFDGSLVIAGERIEIAGWHGMIGHNWGAEHAERWIWLQAPNLGGREGDYLDIAAGRVKLGPWTTPWVANGQLVFEGEAHRVGGFLNTYGTEFSERPASCEFTLPGKTTRIRGHVAAPSEKDIVGWVYADPKGPEHHTLNCSISDMTLTLERPGHSSAEVEVKQAAAYEFGSRDFSHGIELQPFADG